jgi:hypothetical protein
VAETIWTAAVGVFLACWMLASILNQTSLPWWQRVVQNDVLGLLPRWTFFAPNPAHEDVHVVYRDQAASGTWGGWRPLTVAPPDARMRWIWNPGRFERKASIDLVNGLRRSRFRLKENPEALIVCTPYVGLLGWVARQRVEPGATHRQFAVVTSEGFPPQQKLTVEYVSEVHRLDP